MKSDIIKFAKAIIITIGLLVVVDIMVGFVGDRLAWNMPSFSGQIAKDNYRLHRLETEIVIIGSSRGAHHYVTSQLNDSIDKYVGKHISIYNAAIPGKYANSNCCAAEAIISRYKPKLVIFDLPEKQLRLDNIETDIMFSSPYYWSDSIVRRYINNLGAKQSILIKSSMYRYNNKLSRIISSYFQNSREDDGYLPKNGSHINNEMNTFDVSQNFPLNKYSVANFESVLTRYKEAKVPIIVVCSPMFNTNLNNNYIKQICNKYDVKYLDFYHSQYFNNHPEWFYDISHLNDIGAHEFTAILFDSIKTEIKQQIIDIK